MANNNTLKDIGTAGVGYLIASRVAKKLPGTPMWALGWGALATAGTFMLSKKLGRSADTTMAISSGLALGYLHAYSHQTPFPHRDETLGLPAPPAQEQLIEGLGARFLGDVSTHAPGCRCGAH